MTQGQVKMLFDLLRNIIDIIDGIDPELSDNHSLNTQLTTLEEDYNAN